MKMKFSRIQTSIPGPNASKLLEKRNHFVPRGVSNGLPTFAEKARGAFIEDIDGNQFIDFAGAIGTVNVGHCHERVTERLHEQIDRYIHPGFNVMMYEPYIELAEKLANISPGEFEKKVLFLNSGAEAVENAVKIARKYTKRTGVITFSKGFHGRTLMTMTMTSKVKPYKNGFGPFAPDVYRAPFPYEYRRPKGQTKDEYENEMIQAFEDFLHTEVAPEHIACVVMEPVQGEGGFIIPGKRFVQAVRELCTKYGIVFVADEIQTGFGRTGKYFGIEHYEVVPDLITVSKSLAAGLPLSGVIGRKELMDAPEPGELGGTYAGSPLGCAAALAVIDVIEEEHLNERALLIGDKVLEHFRRMQQKYDCIGDVRGVGAMCAMEIVKNRNTKEPNPTLTKQIIQEANRNGVLLIGAGVYSNVIRLLMPLVITDDQLEEGLIILESCIQKCIEKEQMILS